MMEVRIVRVAQGKNSTLGHLYINGRFQCYLLEDAIRAEKIPGKTAIPTGEFSLGVNHFGGMNSKYHQYFGQLHQGMIEITGLPNFSNVYLHVGNTVRDTAGCPLLGFGFLRAGDDYTVSMSRDAYRHVYPQLLKAATDPRNRLIIENDFQF